MTSFLMAMALLAASLPNGVVLQPVANLYSRPTQDADVVSQAIYGSAVGVLEERSGWIRVRTADDYTGWMEAGALKRLAAGAKPYASSGVVVQVANLYANLYREPDVTKHQPLLTLPFETRLEALSRPAAGERWLQVRLPDERLAWVQSGDVTFANRTLSIPEMIELGKRFIGVPYLWGGASSFGYDCSGFTQMLCRRHGVLLPRDAAPQARWNGVLPVDRKDLRPGDLLFFGASPEKITHTGMYIGNGQFLNATTWRNPVVQISDLNDPHWTALLVACRRLR